MHIVNRFYWNVLILYVDVPTHQLFVPIDYAEGISATFAITALFTLAPCFDSHSRYDSMNAFPIRNGFECVHICLCINAISVHCAHNVVDSVLKYSEYIYESYSIANYSTCKYI